MVGKEKLSLSAKSDWSRDQCPGQRLSNRISPVWMVANPANQLSPGICSTVHGSEVSMQNKTGDPNQQVGRITQCISQLLQCNKSSQTQWPETIFIIFMVFVHQESGQDLSGFYSQGYLIKELTKPCFHLESGEKLCSNSLMLLAEFSSLQCRTEAPVFLAHCQPRITLLLESVLRFLSCGPYHL